MKCVVHLPAMTVVKVNGVRVTLIHSVDVECEPKDVPRMFEVKESIEELVNISGLKRD